MQCTLAPSMVTCGTWAPTDGLGRKDLAISSQGGDDFANSLLFSNMTLWVSGERQNNAEPSTAQRRRESTNQAARLNGKNISKKEVFYLTLEEKLFLCVASKSFRKWHKWKSQEFFSINRYLLPKMLRKKHYVSRIKRPTMETAYWEGKWTCSHRSFCC